MDHQVDELTATLQSERAKIERLEVENRALSEQVQQLRVERGVLRRRLKQQPHEIAAERDTLSRKLHQALELISSFLSNPAYVDPPLASDDDSDSDPLDELAGDLAALQDDEIKLDSDTSGQAGPSRTVDTSSLPSPPVSHARPIRLSSSPAAGLAFHDYRVCFADRQPRPIEVCKGPYDLDHLCQTLAFDDDKTMELHDLCTAVDLHPRICMAREDILFLYHPIVLEEDLGEETMTYFVDWGNDRIVDRLERRILDQPQDKAFHIFVQPRSKVHRWYYYGAHQMEVMDIESLDIWAQLLDNDEHKAAIVEHMRTRSKMGDVDVEGKIETCALTQIAFEIIAGPDQRASQIMARKLEPAET